MVECLFHHQREFLASSCSDSSASAGSGLRIAEEIKRIQSFANKHVFSPYSRHLQYIGCTISSLGWVVVRNKPGQFIRTKYDDGHANVGEIVRDNCDNITKDWLFAWLDLIGELEVYVGTFHCDGLKWNK